MDRRIQVVIDAGDPKALGTFWATALGYIEEPPPEPHGDWPSALRAWGLPEDKWNTAYAVVDPDGVGPRVYLQQVPEGKVAKNRVHLDVGVPGSKPGERADKEAIRAHAARLVEAGGTVLKEFDDQLQGFWIVMADPEGNEFCACG